MEQNEKNLPESVSFIRETMAEAMVPPAPLPVRRIMEKLDACMSRKDYAGAERHLNYWLEEPRAAHDLRGELTIRNEMMGFYRKTGGREQAIACGEAALELLEILRDETVSGAGTTYVNFGTVCNTFGENERALVLFRRARNIYEGQPATPPELLGGLYNNMGLACLALGRPDEAMDLYDLAMEQMKKVPCGELEQAITCLNMADAVEALQGAEQGEARIMELLDRAAALLDTPEIPQDGYAAYVYEKCMPTFAYYGYFLEAERLRDRAEAIHERT